MLGATIGSFLNVVIYRMPRGMSLSNPPTSFCPNCRHRLGGPDLIPLLSYLLSGRKCRYCGEPVSSRYFWVELINGTLFAAIWWQYFIATDHWIQGCFFAAATATCVAITFIDWELYIIPDELNAFLTVLGFGMAACLHDWRGALLGGLAGWGVIWGMAVLARVAFGKDGMGHGDIKMMRGMGMLLGPALLGASIAVAVVAGLVIGLTMIFLAPKLEAKKKPVVTSEADLVAIETETSVATEYDEPESMGSLMKHGLFYILCGDAIGTVFPKVYSLIGEPQPVKGIDENDGWEPSLTTIPFGPYLAIGCVLCMVFAQPIKTGIERWWKESTGQTALLQPSQTVYRMSGRRA